MLLFDKVLILFCGAVSIASLLIVAFSGPIQDVGLTKKVFLKQDSNRDIILRSKEEFSRRPRIQVPKVNIRPDSVFIGTGFKVSDNLWMSARHVLGDCSSAYVNASYGSSDEDLRLIETVYIHPGSDLAMFRFENEAPKFTVPSINSKETKNSLLRTTAFTVGYPVGIPGQLYVKYLGKAALSNMNYDILEPVFVWTLSSKTPESLTTVGGISGAPLFNSESKIIGVAVAEQVRRGTVSSADLTSINWLLGAVEKQSHSQSVIKDEINPENFNEFADRYRGEHSIVQLFCNTA